MYRNRQDETGTNRNRQEQIKTERKRHERPEQTGTDRIDRKRSETDRIRTGTDRKFCCLIMSIVNNCECAEKS
jgi:hypothetical protein